MAGVGDVEEVWLVVPPPQPFSNRNPARPRTAMNARTRITSSLIGSRQASTVLLLSGIALTKCKEVQASSRHFFTPRLEQLVLARKEGRTAHQACSAGGQK